MSCVELSNYPLSDPRSTSMTAPVLKEAGSKLTGAVPTMRMRPNLREMRDVSTTQEVGCAAY